jgi:hypothetical protein
MGLTRENMCAALDPDVRATMPDCQRVGNTTSTAEICNPDTQGPFTDFFNNIGGCPVKVLFESPNSVRLQYEDGFGYDGYVSQADTAHNWYEVSREDDSLKTTVVLAPLK